MRSSESLCRIGLHSAGLLRTPGPFRTPPVDAFQQHRQLRRRQQYRAFFRLWPDEAACLEPLGEEAQSLTIPAQDLDQIAAFAAENEKLAIERIMSEMLLHL